MKNAKKQRKSTKLIRITIIALLLALLFSPERLNRSLITGIVITIIFGSLLFLLVSLMPRIPVPSFLRNIRFPRTKKRRKKKQKNAVFDMETLLIRQISFQITDRIKASYPKASWEYTRPLKAEYLLNCNVFRIRTFHTGDYNFAEVSLDRYGHLKLSMMTIKNLSPLPGQQDPDTSDPDTPDSNGSNEPSVHVDPESWYSLIGKPLLTDLIGDLQARGHQKLFINEAGEIFILNGNNPEVKDIFQHFPPKDYWAALTDIFIRDELNAKETNNTLELSWI